jgi:hypothetical protein
MHAYEWKVIKNQISVPNYENLLYLNPGTNFFDLSANPYLFDLLNVRAKIVLNLELKDFPIYFYRTSSKLLMKLQVVGLSYRI